MTKKIIIFSALFICLGFVFSSVSQASNLLFSDSFEDGTFNAWAVHAAHETVITSEHHSGTHCAQVNYYTNGSGESQMLVAVPAVTPTNEFYFSYWFKVAATYHVPHDGIWGLGWKWGRLKNSSGGIQTEFYLQSSDWGSVGQSYQTGQSMLGTPGGGNWLPYADSQWHKLEVYGKYNTDGAANGILRIWVDGVQKSNKTTYTWRTGTYSSQIFNWFFMPSNAGTSAADAQPGDIIYIDDAQIWDGMPSGSTTPPATCTSFTYSAFGTCQSNNTQSRTVTSSSPAGCTGGSPILIQSCSYISPTCTESWTCGAWTNWSTCTNNSQSHTRTCTDSKNCGTITTKPAITESQNCTSTNTASGATLLFQDNFEDGDTAGWSQGLALGTNSIDVSHNGSHSMKFVHTQTVGTYTTLAGIPEFYSEWWIYTAPTWPSGNGLKWTKVNYQSTRTMGVNIWWNGDANLSSQWSAYDYSETLGNWNGSSYSRNPYFSGHAPVMGGWLKVGVYAKRNTGAANNGILKIWMSPDDFNPSTATPNYSSTAFRWDNAGTNLFSHFYVMSNIGTPGSANVNYVDDVKIWNGLPSGSTTPSSPTCTSFTYSAFGTCQSNGTQSRTITSSTPTGCVGGSPVLTQSCTLVTTYNLTNFTQLVTDWLKTITSSPADANKDGKVNSQDLGIMMSNWN